MLKIGVLVSGGGTNLQSLIDNIEAGRVPARIAGVISSNPRAYALERAERHGIPARCMRRRDYADADEYEDALAAHFKSLGAELIVLAGFMVILTRRFIDAFGGNIINVHPSLIPSFCGKGFYGLKVHEAALEKGVKVTGATVHYVTPETDAGPIISQRAVYVAEGDTPETLQQRVMTEAEQVILPEAVRLIAEKRSGDQAGKEGRS